MPQEKKTSIRKLWAHPAAQDRTSDQFDKNTGHVLDEDEKKSIRKKKGICPKCGIVRTHKRGVFGVWTKDTRAGQVYKGECLQCNTLLAARLRLGEPVDDLDRGSILDSNAAAAAAAAASHVQNQDQQRHHQDGRFSPTRDGRLSPTRDERLSPTRDGRLPPTRDGRLPPIRDERLSPTRDGRSPPIRDERLSPTRNERLPPMRQLDGMGNTSQSQSRRESSNQGSSWSGSNHVISPPEETVPSEINERLDMPRRFSEISIPPEFQDWNNERYSNGSDYRENSVGTNILMGIVEENQHRNIQHQLHQSHDSVTWGTSPTSIGQRSHGFMSSDGTTTTNITNTFRPTMPGVEHFDGASSSGDRLYQRILDKASQKPPAAVSAAAASCYSPSRKAPSRSFSNSSSATSTVASTTNQYNRSRSHSDNNCVMLPSSPTSLAQTLTTEENHHHNIQHQLHQSHDSVTWGTSPTSIGQQSRGFMSSDGTTTTNTANTFRPTTPGVEHFDGASSSGDRLYQRILDKASQKPPAAVSAAAASCYSPSRKAPSRSFSNSSSATSTVASTTNQYNRSRSHSDNNCVMLPSSPTSLAQSSTTSLDQHLLDSHGASAFSASDQFEARRQKKINDATNLKSLQNSTSIRADDEFNRRLLSKVEGGEDEHSTPGARHATGKDRIYHRKSDDWNQEESKRIESKPGVTHATGKGSSLYNRKMGDEGKRANTVEDEEVEGEKDQVDDCVFRELIGNFTSCGDLFDFLKKNSPLPAPSMIQSLIRMRDLLRLPCEKSSLRSSSVSSGTSGGSDNTNKFLPSDWPNRLFDAISEHPSDKILQAEGFRTMWTIVSTNNHFASDLTSYAAKKDIMRAMETHKKSSSVQGYGAGLIACIASTEKYALQLLNANDGKFIKRLMDALKVHYDDGDDHHLNGGVQQNALKALYHLSSASLASSRQMVFFGKKMGRCAVIVSAENNPSLHAVEAVLHALERQLKNASVQIFGNKLLYNIFSVDEIDDEERCDKWISKYLRYAMAAKRYHVKSRPFCESIICLLSKISDRGSAILDGNLFPGIIADVMSSSDSSLVAQHGCRCFHNVCARDCESASTSQDVVASVDGIKIIFSCMTTFKEHQSIQSEGCLALVALCANSSNNKAIVLQQGGIDVIFSAYLSCGSSKTYEGVGLMTKIRACTALISLALDPASHVEMNRTGIIKKFNNILKEDEKMPLELSCLVKRLLVLISDEECDDWPRELKDGASKDETMMCVLANFRMITQADDHLQIDTSSLISNLLFAMRKFSNSRAIHENANKALACFYSSNQGQAQAEDIYTNVLEAVEVSLREHQQDHNVVAAACSVIKNICITCLTPAGVQPSQVLLDDTLYRSILEVDNAMEICKSDITAVEQASGALWAMCNYKPSLVVSLGTINPGRSNTVNVLTTAMKRFPSSMELHRNAIGVMHMFFNRSENILKDKRSIDCIVDVSNVLATFMKDSEGDEGAAGTALDILKVLADERGHDAKIALSENVDIIAGIVSCMYMYPSSLIIQGKACDILRSLAVTNLKRSQICAEGGTTKIIEALRSMKDDPIFVCKAFMALENLLSGADIEVLTANKTTNVLLNAIEFNAQSINVQIHGANVIWHLSSRQNSFKEALVRHGAARLIADAMTRFLPSQEMQQKGCIAIWSISAQKALKVEVGRYVIAPIIEGVSAHCSPDDLSPSQGDKQKFCEDALGALKCLSTATSNKRLLEESGAVDLICSILWIHGDNAGLCQSALSALSNICVDIDTKQVLRISADVLDVLVHTMIKHHATKEVQSIAIILLRNFTFSPSNVFILQQNMLVTKLVNNAMVNFNTNFQGRAEDVLRVLPSLPTQ